MGCSGDVVLTIFSGGSVGTLEWSDGAEGSGPGSGGCSLGSDAGSFTELLLNC